jgi:transposase
VWDFVDGLDLSDLYAKVKSVEYHPGRPAIDAKILFAVWLYATLDGETSGRRISILCSEFNPYIWLCGGIEINHHTLSDFYTDHAAKCQPTCRIFVINNLRCKFMGALPPNPQGIFTTVMI